MLSFLHGKRSFPCGTDCQSVLPLRKTAIFIAVTALPLLLADPVRAQLPQTTLTALSPTGGKAGTTFDVKVAAGSNLEDLDRLVFSRPGITAAQKMQEKDGAKQPVPNTFTVTIAADVPPGLYEARAGGLYGLSNPRTFVVGVQPEVTESEPNNTVEQAMEIPLGQLVNGAAGGGQDLDWFKFSGKKDQRVICACRAARIDSRMQAALEVYDAEGNRLAFGRQEVREDPLVDLTLPADGDYFVKVYDFLYRGGSEYYYRLAIGTGPHLDYVLPPVGVPGTTDEYTLYGRNLPESEPAGVSLDGRPLEKKTVKISLPEDSSRLLQGTNLASFESSLDGFSYSLQTPQGVSNPVLIQFGSGPAVLEKEPNDTPAESQEISVPAELAGQFQKKADIDHFTFAAKAKDVFFIEAFGQRGGSTADPYLTLDQVTRNDKGEESTKRIATLDDYGTNLAPDTFDTAVDDPVYRFEAPADGTYRISVRDRYFEARGNPRLVYRISIRREQPDFRLVALPLTPPPANNQPGSTGTIGLRKGDNIAAQVLAFRIDGFNEQIEITAEGLPEGVTCQKAAIAPGQNDAQLIFTAAENAPEWSGPIRVIGKAKLVDQIRLQAASEAKAAAQSAAEALKAAQASAAQAEASLKQVQEALARAKAAAARSPKDEAIAAKVVEIEKTAEVSAQTAAQTASSTDAAAKTLAEIETALAAAESAAVRNLIEEARPGTIVWNGAQNVPTQARLARTLVLSVLNEPAPFQVTSPVHEVQVNQGRQLLMPVNLARRTGFDNQVALTFDIPKSSRIQAQNKPIPKDKDSELLRLFIPNNATEGTHTVYLRTQGQVSYRRNLVKYQQAKAEQAEAAKQAQAAAESAKQAQAALDEAAKKATADAEALKKATEAKTTADAAAKTAAEAVRQAQVEKEKADTSAAKTAEVAKIAAEAAAAAKKAADGSPDDKVLAEAAAAVQTAADSAAQSAKKAAETKTAADKKLADAQEEQKKALAAVTEAEKALQAAEAAAKASVAAKAEAEKAAKQAEEQSKAAADQKAAADKTVAEMEKAKPQNINYLPPSTPLLITVKPAPARLTASVPGGGNLKRGEKIDVTVKVRRENGFNGPLTLTLPLPPGVTGLSAEPVTVPADKDEGVISIHAAAEATEGQLANMVIRATCDFQGEAAVDVPVTLKVAK